MTMATKLMVSPCVGMLKTSTQQSSALFQKADSRLPYISYRTGINGIRGTSIGMTSSTVGRGAPVVGMLGNLTGSGFAATYNPVYNDISVDDSMA